MKREFFKILRAIKKFDRNTKSFHINISYKTATAITPRTLVVSEAFGLGLDKNRSQVLYDNVNLRIGPKDIIYITGESGSGKSVLLRHLEKLLRSNAVSIHDIKFDASKPIIETIGKTVEEGLTLLCKVGLNDAFLFLRNYKQLSDGQKYRYRIAKLVETKKQYWIMDEFCSTLDRDTAKIVAFNLQKLVRQEGKAILVATTHTDLQEDLAPTVRIHKYFGREINVKSFPHKLLENCSISKHVSIRKGSMTDYHKLAEFHYRESKRLPPPRKIFAMERTDVDELVGVIVYSYPPPLCSGRNKALLGRRLRFKELNSQLSLISRVILHPKYRTIGLGTKLVKDTLTLAETPFVEAVAVMAKYNPFFEKAGMTKITAQRHDSTYAEAINQLHQLGFNPYLLPSEKLNKEKVEELSIRQKIQLNNILGKIKNPRLRRTLENNPYVDDDSYKAALEKASYAKLANMLKTLSILSQEKIYLFWTASQQKVF
jgi:ABC-type transport system involved in cytochrome c biogenesis ATPase subunit/N-acetylglutamate synthase-like GNAT family acetyltransferase